MHDPKLLAAAIAASVLLIAAALGVALGVSRGGSDDEGPARAGDSSTATDRRAARESTRPQGCRNLRLSPRRRAALEQVLRHDAAPGSVYYGACEGRYWAMATFADGGDGVFRDVLSVRPVALGSIVEAKCRVPRRLLALWRQEGGCAREPVERPQPEPEPAPQPTPEPHPQPEPEPPTGGERRYPNGRTYIEQVNFCNLMRDQGVPCTVPPPL